jgi:hypothetical protein
MTAQNLWKESKNHRPALPAKTKNRQPSKNLGSSLKPLETEERKAAE